MEENMTDKQMEVILNLVADKFSNCKNMEEVAKAVQEVKNMAKKKSLTNRLQRNRKGGGLAKAAQSVKNIIKGLWKNGKTKE